MVMESRQCRNNAFPSMFGSHTPVVISRLNVCDTEQMFISFPPLGRLVTKTNLWHALMNPHHALAVTRTAAWTGVTVAQGKVWPCIIQSSALTALPLPLLFHNCFLGCVARLICTVINTYNKTPIILQNLNVITEIRSNYNTAPLQK